MRAGEEARRYAGRIARLVLALDSLPDAAQEHVVRIVERGVQDYKECYTESDLAAAERRIMADAADYVARLRNDYLLYAGPPVFHPHLVNNEPRLTFLGREDRS